MNSYYINNVEFNIKERYIQVANNWGNKIYFDNIEDARRVYKAIKNGNIKVQTTCLGSFETINAICNLIKSYNNTL